MNVRNFGREEIIIGLLAEIRKKKDERLKKSTGELA